LRAVALDRQTKPVLGTVQVTLRLEGEPEPVLDIRSIELGHHETQACRRGLGVAFGKFEARPQILAADVSAEGLLEFFEARAGLLHPSVVQQEGHSQIGHVRRIGNRNLRPSCIEHLDGHIRLAGRVKLVRDGDSRGRALYSVHQLTLRRFGG